MQRYKNISFQLKSSVFQLMFHFAKIKAEEKKLLKFK